jgi:hypothetical protein
MPCPPPGLDYSLLSDLEAHESRSARFRCRSLTNAPCQRMPAYGSNGRPQVIGFMACEGHDARLRRADRHPKSDSVGSLFGSLGPAFWLGGRTRGAQGSTLITSPWAGGDRFFYGQQTGTAQFRAQFGLLWLLPGSVPRPSGWRLQIPLNRGVTPWCHTCDPTTDVRRMSAS